MTRSPSATPPESAKEDLTSSALLDIFRLLCLTQLLQEQMPNPLQGQQQRQSPAASTSVAAVSALRRGDVIVPQAEDLGAYLAAGLQPERILAQHFGREAGFTNGRDGALSVGDLSHGLLPTLPFVGANVPLACGAALALRGGTAIALTFLDESYISSGDAHEGLNFAAVLRLPLVVIVQGSLVTSASPIASPAGITERAEAYGIHVQRVDGDDPLAVFFAAGEAVAGARSGLGPAIVHARASELGGDNSRSASRLDGLTRLAAFLRDEGIMSEEQRAELERAVEQDVALAADWAEAERMPSEASGPVVFAQAGAIEARPATDGRLKIQNA